MCIHVIINLRHVFFFFWLLKKLFPFGTLTNWNKNDLVHIRGTTT